MDKKTSLISILFISLCIQISILADTVAGKSGMVVTSHPMASKFGLEILKSGGNAIDAAVGAAIVLGVVEPNASGLGGGGGMLIYLHKKDSLTFINYYSQAPGEIPQNFDYREESSSARSVLVPGTVAGLHHALINYGSMKWKTLIERAIQTLRSGLQVDASLYKIILDSYEKLMEYAQTSSIYLIDDFPPEEGSIIHNERLLNTLEKLAQAGPDIFYKGEIADSIETAIIKHGGTLRKSDLEKYQVDEIHPVRGTYRVYEIFSAPPPFSGLSVIEILNILELQNLSQLGDFTTNPKSFHFMAEAMKLAYADRQKYLGDPNFYDVPTSVLISKDFAKSRFQKINMDRALEFDVEPTGDVTPFLNTDKEDKNGSTTHISVVDAAGNAVSLTQTLNFFWGAGISVCGFLMNNGMTSFSRNPANQVEPFKQPRTTIAPSLVFKNHELNMVIGTPGAGRIISTMAEVICNVIDFNKPAQEANDAPRFYSRQINSKLTVESRFSPAVLEKLEEMGHEIEILGEMDLFFGGVQLILIDQENKTLIGSSDPRRSGVATGD